MYFSIESPLIRNLSLFHSLILIKEKLVKKQIHKSYVHRELLIINMLLKKIMYII